MKKLDENIKKQYFNTCTCSNYDINKSILLLQKIICPYKHMIGKSSVKIHYLKKKIFTVI